MVKAQTWHVYEHWGALSSGVDGFSLPCPRQKFKKPWKGPSIGNWTKNIDQRQSQKKRCEIISHVNMNEFTVGSKFRPRSRESHICCTDPCGPRFKPLTLESSLQKMWFPTASGFTGFVWEISHFPQIKHSCTSLSEIPTIFIYLIYPFGRNLSVQVIIGSIPRGICHSNFCIFFFFK